MRSRAVGHTVLAAVAVILRHETPVSVWDEICISNAFAGIFLALSMAPLLHWIRGYLDIQIDNQYLFILEIIAWGWVVSISDMYIYMIFEGRRYWPECLRNWLISRQELRLDRFRQQITLKNSNPEAEIEYGLYPIKDDGDAYVKYPTRIGNIIHSFETYPKVKYGLDGVFYWYRLWVVIDKDLREEIDNAQAVADSAIYLAFVFYLSGILMLLYGIIACIFGVKTLPYIPGPKTMFSWTIICFVLGFCVYRLSLQVHVQFGELFKSIFDQFRSRLLFDDVVREVGETICDFNLPFKKSQREKNKIVWRYLRWHLIRDEATNKNLTVGEWQDRKKSKAPAEAS